MNNVLATWGWIYEYNLSFCMCFSLFCRTFKERKSNPFLVFLSPKGQDIRVFVHWFTGPLVEDSLVALTPFAWAMGSESNNLGGRNTQTHCSSEQRCVGTHRELSVYHSGMWNHQQTQGKVKYKYHCIIFNAVANSRIFLTIFIQSPADVVSLIPC